VFLVGGFSQSPLLQKRIKDLMVNRARVVIPPNPGQAVMNGAVYFGMNPNVIVSRIAPQTIGIGIWEPWNQKEHNGRKQIMRDEELFCGEIFSSFVKVGESVHHLHTVKKQFIPPSKSDTKISIEIWTATDPDVKYTTDNTCRQIGEVVLQVPDKQLSRADRKLEVIMQFGGPTFTVKATYLQNNSVVEAKFNFFLNDTPQLKS